jgi:hypothetical protein
LNFHGKRYFNTYSNAYVKTGMVAWIKITFSGNPNYKESET